jgi:hypothetical protein
MLEPVQRWIERPLVDLEDILRNFLDALRDRPSVERRGLEDAQDEEIEGAGEEIGLRWSRH